MKRYLVVLCILFYYSSYLFAQQTVGLFLNTKDALEGYTLFTPNVYTNTYLIDNCGRIVNEWESGFLPGLSAYLLESGNLLRTARTIGAFNGGGSGWSH